LDQGDIMALPSNKNENYTYRDYLTWPEEERWELIDGIPYMQATPSRIHQEISGALFLQFGNYLKGKPCKVYHPPFCVRLPKKDEFEDDVQTVVEPDLTVVCDQSKLDDKGCKGSPDLIIEIISDSTGRRDKLDKFNKYEVAGVKEYWIIEPGDKLASVFKLGENKRYGRPEVYSEEAIIKVEMFPGLEVDLRDVFN
jgi:Uma2 family endonuclease